MTPKVEDAGKEKTVYGRGRDKGSKAERLVGPGKGHWDFLAFLKQVFIVCLYYLRRDS